MAFGYYPRDLSFAAGDIAIEPVPDLEQTIAPSPPIPALKRTGFTRRYLMASPMSRGSSVRIPMKSAAASD
jgi:hypothetical protein